MDKSPGKTAALLIRRSKFIYLFRILVLILIFGVNVLDKSVRNQLLSFFYGSSWLSLLISGIVLSIISYQIFLFADNRIMLKISDDGIWTKKYGTVSWTEIAYLWELEPLGLYTRNSYSLIIKSKRDFEANSQTEMKIDLSKLNIGKPVLRKVLGQYCGKYGVRDLGPLGL